MLYAFDNYDLFIIHDNSWYDYQYMCDTYPNDSILCYIDESKQYQPKVLTTYLLPDDMYELNEKFHSDKYSSKIFYGTTWNQLHATRKVCIR